MPYCQSCGTYGETAFCTGCGQPLVAPPAQQQTQPHDQPDAQQYAQPGPTQAVYGTGTRPTQYGQQPGTYQAPAQPYPHGSAYPPPQEQRVASAYYVALVAMVFAILGGILGMFLAVLAGWMAKKQQDQGLARAQQAANIANLAFLVATVVFLVLISMW